MIKKDKNIGKSIYVSYSCGIGDRQQIPIINIYIKV